MGANYKQLAKFTKDIEKLNASQKEEFLESCCKELAARLLRGVISKTKSNTGTLRRGWTVGTHSDAAAGKNVAVNEWCNSVEIKKIGNVYRLDIINPVDYASYYEYGHRTSSGAGWVEGRFPLTIAEAELNAVSDGVLARKLKTFLKGVMQ